MTVDFYAARYVVHRELGTILDFVSGEAQEQTINMSNVNAARILGLLGYKPDHGELMGQATSDDLLGRVLVATALQGEDEGMPAHELPGPGAKMIDCGRHPGYTDRRFRDLVELAEYCAKHDFMIGWA